MEYDSHSLYVFSGPLTEAQLREAFVSVHAELQKKLRRKIDTFIDINIPKRGGQGMGFCYVYLGSSELYHALNGKNPDGSDRKRWIPDPDYKRKEDDDFDIPASGCWADTEEEEIPMIQVEDPILVESPTVRVTDEQKAWIEADFRHRAYLTESGGYRIRVSPLQSGEIDSVKYIPNILICRRADPSLQPADLGKIFRRYTTSASSRNFPKVEARGKKMVVVFDPSTRDALFAHKMTMRRELPYNGRTVHLEMDFFIRPGYTEAGPSTQ